MREFKMPAAVYVPRAVQCEPFSESASYVHLPTWCVALRVLPAVLLYSLKLGPTLAKLEATT